MHYFTQLLTSFVRQTCCVSYQKSICSKIETLRRHHSRSNFFFFLYLMTSVDSFLCDEGPSLYAKSKNLAEIEKVVLKGSRGSEDYTRKREWLALWPNFFPLQLVTKHRNWCYCVGTTTGIKGVSARKLPLLLRIPLCSVANFNFVLLKITIHHVNLPKSWFVEF